VCLVEYWAECLASDSDECSDGSLAGGSVGGSDASSADGSANDSDVKKDDCSAGSRFGSQIGCSGEYSVDCLAGCSVVHSDGCSVWPTAAPNVIHPNALAMLFVTQKIGRTIGQMNPVTNDPLIGSATGSAKHARQMNAPMIREMNDQTNALSILTMSVSATPQQRNQ
jgi:hypothetical protein